jgi:hypothetical protein
LHKREIFEARLGSAEQAGCRHTRCKAPNHPSAGPLHAFQEAAAVDVALKDTRRAFPTVFRLRHCESLSVAAERRFRLARLSFRQIYSPAEIRE